MGSLLPLGPNAILQPGNPSPVPPHRFAVPDGLEIYWGMDIDCVDMTTARAFDLSGKGSLGIITGMTAADIAAGQVGQALTFGAGKYITQSTAGTTLTRFTCSAWVNSTSTAAQQQIIMKGGNTDATYFLQVATGGTVQFGFNDASASYRFATSSVSITTNIWWFICGTFDGTTVRIYLNGVLNVSSAQAFTPMTVAEAPTVGVLGIADLFNFIGRIDEARVYDRAIDSSEVMELFVTGMAGLRTKMFGLGQWDAPAMAPQAAAGGGRIWRLAGQGGGLIGEPRGLAG